MTRVVFDTNVLISAVLFGGTPRALLVAAIEGRFRLHISRAILTEVNQVLRDKFNYRPAAIELLNRELLALCEWVEPAEEIVACRDPDDNRILECAAAVGADYLVSGDRDLLELHPFRGIAILSPARFSTLQPWKLH